jgi:meso-butanediol dehydrogenase / (S,S)-butanediol dehydrogenase / diacetyl reductase
VRNALITGGASGFGFRIAERLADDGASVALLDVDSTRLEDAVARIGSGALALTADVRSPASVGEAVAECEATLGGLDTLVLSAGVIETKPLADVTEEDWDRTLDVNLKGAFLTAQAAAPALRSSGRGRIVAISSDAGRRGFAMTHAYCASKFGLIGLIESLAAELAPDAVTANCVCPVGCPTTGMGQQLLASKVAASGAAAQEIMRRTARGNPLGRNASEDDVADAVVFFVSDAAAFLTGVALDVDGGAHLGGGIPGIS